MPVVGFSDGPDIESPIPIPFRFVVNSGLKNSVKIFRVNSCPSVRDHYCYVMTFTNFGSHRQSARLLCGGHGFYGVRDQVYKQLL